MIMWDNENISDELLAAFLDGNTTQEETEQMLEAMQFDDIREIMQISSSWKETMSMYDGDFGFLEMGIDPVLYEDNALMSSIDLNYEEATDDTSNLNIFQNNDDNNNVDTDNEIINI